MQRHFFRFLKSTIFTEYYTKFQFKRTIVKRKRQKTVKIFIKILILLLSLGYIFQRISKGNFTFVESFDSPNYCLLMLVIFLTTLNWLSEAKKWQILISHIEKISIFTSLKAVFTGLVTGIITPNRIGEWAGRIFVLKRKNRPAGILSTAAGSMAQLTVSLFFGLISFSVVAIRFGGIFKNINSLNSILMLIVGLIIISVLLLILVRMKNFAIYLSKIHFLKKYSENLLFASEYSLKTMLFTIGLSILRYLIFVTQYFLLLRFFHVEISAIHAFLGIALTYFVLALIPTVTLTELGIRGSAALWFIGFFAANDMGIIAATFAVWIINIAFPTALGAVFFVRAKL